jgi:hypothetical protein
LDLLKEHIPPSPNPSTAQTFYMDTMIKEFRQRANNFRITAFWILAIIFLLLLGGATAFAFAPQITLSDFYPDTEIDTKLSDIPK